MLLPELAVLATVTVTVCFCWDAIVSRVPTFGKNVLAKLAYWSGCEEYGTATSFSVKTDNAIAVGVVDATAAIATPLFDPLQQPVGSQEVNWPHITPQQIDSGMKTQGHVLEALNTISLPSGANGQALMASIISATHSVDPCRQVSLGLASLDGSYTANLFAASGPGIQVFLQGRCIISLGRAVGPMWRQGGSATLQLQKGDMVCIGTREFYNYSNHQTLSIVNTPAAAATLKGFPAAGALYRAAGHLKDAANGRRKGTFNAYGDRGGMVRGRRASWASNYTNPMRSISVLVFTVEEDLEGCAFLSANDTDTFGCRDLHLATATNVKWPIKEASTTTTTTTSSSSKAATGATRSTPEQVVFAPATPIKLPTKAASTHSSSTNAAAPSQAVMAPAKAAPAPISATSTTSTTTRSRGKGKKGRNSSAVHPAPVSASSNMSSSSYSSSNNSMSRSTSSISISSSNSSIPSSGWGSSATTSSPRSSDCGSCNGWGNGSSWTNTSYSQNGTNSNSSKYTSSSNNSSNSNSSNTTTSRAAAAPSRRQQGQLLRGAGPKVSPAVQARLLDKLAAVAAAQQQQAAANSSRVSDQQQRGGKGYNRRRS